MKIIPTIELVDGKCVQSSKGDYKTTNIYDKNPLAVAKEFEGIGITDLHLVDLDDVKTQNTVNLDVLKSIADNTNLNISFDGHIKSNADIELVFELGAEQVILGTIAVENKSIFLSWLEQYTAKKLIIKTTVQEENTVIQGWQSKIEVTVWAFLDYYTLQGVEYLICTDISNDGILAESSLDLYANILKKYPNLKLIVNDHISSIAELEELEKMGIYGIIIKKAIYDNKISMTELGEFIKKNL
jgi:phosphoribosylformimino-5-aminoimidazole carboxamide ribotide isomerase